MDINIFAGLVKQVPVRDRKFFEVADNYSHIVISAEWAGFIRSALEARKIKYMVSFNIKQGTVCFKVTKPNKDFAAYISEQQQAFRAKHRKTRLVTKEEFEKIQAAAK